MTHPVDSAVAPAAQVPSVTLKLDDIPERTPHPVTIGRRALLLFRYGDWVYATAARCTHQGVELAGGELSGSLLRCPWHGVKFDVRTGARVNQPNCRDLRTFRTEVEDDQVTVYDQAISAPKGAPS
ncbi:Rieske 2Fe-2S domain-containing protein [Streptomyces olindensis]|uniref:Rieske 2Fe-2S domain-containing protein n=1 Tax=Streptomyces olindensis TaxID=358823 RepID=A0ABV2XP58_9ACTN|nr:hypothetical protein DF19_14015 [Streptomyces olindensis]